MNTIRLLIVDDDEDISAFMKRRLLREAPHFSISNVQGGTEALEFVKNSPVDCILADYQMPGMDGLELLKRLKELGNETPFIFVTAQGNEEVASEAFKGGASDYFTKEIGFAHFARIINSIEQAVRRRDAERQRAAIERQHISERKALEQKKAEFLAMVTHDLRSPLSTIKGYAELMTEILPTAEKCDQKIIQMAKAIKSAGQKLEDLVEDFLVVSRLEAGRMELHPVPVDLAALLEGIKKGFLQAAQKKGIILTSEIAGLPDMFMDKKYIERAVSNLLENAVNHTSAGGRVVLMVEARSRKAGGRRSRNDFIAISVQDTGPGIADEEKARIFDKYYRSSKSSGIKGTGLGLAIVKAVAEAHGGRVSLESELGRGSTFTLYLPAGMETRKAA